MTSIESCSQIWTTWSTESSLPSPQKVITLLYISYVADSDGLSIAQTETTVKLPLNPLWQDALRRYTETTGIDLSLSEAFGSVQSFDGLKSLVSSREYMFSQDRKKSSEFGQVTKVAIHFCDQFLDVASDLASSVC